jgi:PAS domain S-box-containing protein
MNAAVLGGPPPAAVTSGTPAPGAPTPTARRDGAPMDGAPATEADPSRAAAFPRSLPTAALLLAAAVGTATGLLPVVDRELVVAGLALGLLATGLARLADRAGQRGTGAVVVPVAQFGAVALLVTGTGSPAALFLLIGPVLSPAAGRRRGVVVSVLGTAGVLLAPGLLGDGTPVAADLPAALLLGPLAAALGSAAVGRVDRRSRAQAAEIERLRTERSALQAQVLDRAEELDVATRMLAARARTMTSVIDAVTEQSIIGTDTDGLVRVWNPGAEKLLGLPRSEVVRRRSIVEFHDPQELDAAAAGLGSATGMAALVAAAVRTGSDVRDWTYVSADGSRRTVSVAITPRTDDRGGHTGWTFVGTDMTEARAAERLKDQFVSLISHELRTPLSSVLGYLELVLDDERALTDEQRGYLRTVERNAQRLHRLVGDLLFTAQVEAGRFALESGDVDLTAVVRAAEETARPAAASAGVTVRVDLPEGGLVVAGDAGRLGQACDNLVSNAVKFTPSGGLVTLALRPGWRCADGTVVDSERPDAVAVARLEVSDTGIGIPAGEQSRLSTRFFRASTAQRAAVPGVGLGLTITRAIAAAHGGTLDVRSTEGRGTTFTLVLPRG